ncbi:TetR/AcrR family transcriptional regulator [Companilactobacillus crustorum]|uniref:TetR/AcrR family transcriptional regulator n=1 Tax=Companilactobacillus crustorum TaxID=392416 RepID=UPI000957AD33|nr:TetR/AcrR family transcriptional regulator [Companilactobacillus crustorum]APU71402.1 hypothetical protein BI355_1083 [Companilactobacillus crustorum]
MEQAFQDLDNWLKTAQMPNGKKKVLKAALELFSKQGYDGTSTAQIAETSGMSQATIFKYFKSKDDLLLFIIEPIIEHILPVYGKTFAKQIQSNEHDLKELIHFIVHNRYQFLVQNKDAVMILTTQILVNDQIKGMFLKKITSIKAIFLNNVWQALNDTKELRSDLDVTQFLLLMIGQLLFYFLQNQRITPERTAQQIESDLDQIETTVLRAINK